MRRGEVRLSTSRTACSRAAYSTTLARSATPIGSAKCRSASGGKPRPPRPEIAGRRGARPQHPRAVRELARAHPPEEIEVLLDGAAAVRALLARLGERSPVLADLVGGEVVDVGEPALDEQLGPRVELVEVVGGVVQVRAPV